MIRNVEQPFWMVDVAAPAKPMPKLNYAPLWIPAAHITVEFLFSLRVLIRMAVRLHGLSGQQRHATALALLPEADV